MFLRRGVSAGEDYTLSGEPTATAPGTYSATATLNDTINCEWSDGTTEPKTISWLLSDWSYSVHIRDIIELGHYEQDNDPSNGAEPIEWRILAVEGELPGRALVVSVKGLDCQQYQSVPYVGNAWEGSDLKAWLETDFRQTAFYGNEEQRLDSYPFCLTQEQARNYFTDDADRICIPTPYAVGRGVHPLDGGACDWWLNEPHKYNPGDVECVKFNGAFTPYHVDDDTIAVRPALWVKLQ